jgi:hypothetical protein
MTHSAFAIDQGQEFVTEQVLAEHIRKPGDGLLDGSDALDDAGSFLQQGE